ncbi:MAG: hypothetical protein G3I10_00585 [Ferrovum sp.]|nr:hypothetical protein [Ferrovum sp.]
MSANNHHKNTVTGYSKCRGKNKNTNLPKTLFGAVTLATFKIPIIIPPSAKPWKGEGPGVFEIVEDHRGDAYRVAYTVRFAKAVYVLHCFQKKSPSGIRTARNDVDLIHEHLKMA